MLLVKKVGLFTFFRLVGQYAKGRYRQYPDLILDYHGQKAVFSAREPAPPGAHHVDAQPAVAVHQVKGGLRPHGQGFQVIEQFPALGAEDFQKVVPRPLWDVGDRHMVQARPPVKKPPSWGGTAKP